MKEKLVEINKLLDEKGRDISLLILRLVFGGIMMLGHGRVKLLKLFDDAPIQFLSVFGMSETVSFYITVLNEFFFTLLLVVGFKSRFVALILSATMLVASIQGHIGDPLISVPIFNFHGYVKLLIPSRETAVLYFTVYSCLILAGPGKYSIDHLLKESKNV